ncbi:MAG: glycosyltransferase family 39 protein [Chloroflexi bacterium]|nr:glycosyltransferase family 39 protein [Chloroflexota bacterium]
MPVLRLLVFGLALAFVALPGHPLSPAPGLPLGLLGIALWIVIAGWSMALPGVPPRPRLVLGALTVLAGVRVGLSLLAPGYGALAAYTTPPGSDGPAVEQSTDFRGVAATRVDRALDLQGDTFPVHFFNDIRRFNFYTANDPKRDLLPFSVRWTGSIVVPADGRYQLDLESNGPAALDLGNPVIQHLEIDRAGRLREAKAVADVPAGLVPLVITYQRPDEGMPSLSARFGPEGTEPGPIAAPRIVQPGTSPESVARDAWLAPLALSVDSAYLSVLLLAFLTHLWRGQGVRPTSSRERSRTRLERFANPGHWSAAPASATRPVRRRSAATAPVGTDSGTIGGSTARATAVGTNRRRADVDAATVEGANVDGVAAPHPQTGGPAGINVERVLLGLFVVAALGRELVAHLSLAGRAVILSGGNDWLAYESFARDILLNGPLLTEGRALGQGLPFYYQPLYIYGVALSHLAFGEGLFAPLFANTVLGVAASLLVYLLTRRLYGCPAAVLALLLFEGYRVTVFAQTAGLLLSENLLIPLVPLLLLALVRALQGGLGALVAAGVVLGLAGLTRTTPLAIVPPASLTLFVAYRRLRIDWLGVAGRLMLLVLACGLTVSVATARNYLVSGRPVPITSSAGANLWETHRPSDKVDLSRIDKDPLYDRLGFDRPTREVAEFLRQDPAGYVGTLAPMFLYAIGVVGAIDGTLAVHPGLFGLWCAYLLVTLLVPRARSLPSWFLHGFIWTHLAQMTVFFSHQYGFRLILPMYVAMVPIVAVGVVALASALGRLGQRVGASARVSTWSRRARPLAATAGGVLVVLVGAGTAVPSPREAFYGLSGDAALATRQALRADVQRTADTVYFVGDDSRSTDVAYLRGLAYPTLRWFDGARGVVFPPAGEQALYVVPQRAAADVAARCLGDGARIDQQIDPASGGVVDVYLTSAEHGECAEARLPIGALFADTGLLDGLDAPASIEPGKSMEVAAHWTASDRPTNRARPFVRLVDSRGRRWGQTEIAVYPSSAWRPGETAVGMARLDLDPTLPPGEYRLEAGFTAGSGVARLADDGPWGRQGQTQVRAGSVRLVSRSAPLAPESLPLSTRLDETFEGVQLLGVARDRETPRPGGRLRLGLFWRNAAGRLTDRDVVLLLRGRDGAVVREWRGVPVDGTYPTSAWKPAEVVRDTWDLVLPADLAAGEVELVAGLAAPGEPVGRVARIASFALESIARRTDLPEVRTPQDVRFGNARLVGLTLGKGRMRPGDTLDVTLYWQASGPIGDNLSVALMLLGADDRVLIQVDGEPASGRRPTAGWLPSEYIEDSYRLRVPRDAPREGLRLAVALTNVVDGARISTSTGEDRVILSVGDGSE